MTADRPWLYFCAGLVLGGLATIASALVLVVFQ